MEGKKELSEGMRNVIFLSSFTKYIPVHFAIFIRVIHDRPDFKEHGICTES